MAITTIGGRVITITTITGDRTATIITGATITTTGATTITAGGTITMASNG
ncbi:hypothetical protein [Methylorubrum extorquens]|uniref:Uncharacterized protein n=1 Tax=Methylorubrum extorquens (strain CM4 / NCIMB 13688) TaxID=440085 RepID=B7L1G4_METC4|nr:hypothetical protein [Methylorubrum extorquens]ACK81058.1 hypothetical protein Mchl_0106 [Methylorubrum extorquens CM4]